MVGGAYWPRLERDEERSRPIGPSYKNCGLLVLKFRSSFYPPKESKSIESSYLKLKCFGVKLQGLYKKALYVHLYRFQNNIHCLT